MRLFGYDLSIRKAASTLQARDTRSTAGLQSVCGSSRRGWMPLIVHEPNTGSWQANLSESPDSVLAYFAVYACTTLIAGDLAKMRLGLVEYDEDAEIWVPRQSAAFSPVLRKPNRYQTRVQFVEWWMTSKLTWGNTYALKQRDARGVVVAEYILDPCRVTVLVAPDGGVFYECNTDNLTGLTAPVVIPAREILHDRVCPLFHPLVGVSPLFAAALPATQGLKIERNSLEFFANNSQPGGTLTTPSYISQETADEMKARWEAEFSGPEAAGRVAILGDGLKYEPIGHTALHSQLLEQLKFTAEMVCACYHVMPYQIGIGTLPSYTNPEAVQQMYLAGCLQIHIRNFQKVQTEGLELPLNYAVHFDLDDLLQMDTATKMQVAVNGVNAAVLTPNEARQKFNLAPQPGGESVYLQQQYYSLEALNQRDAAPPTPAIAPAPPAPEADDEEAVDAEAIAAKVATITRKAWRGAA